MKQLFVKILTDKYSNLLVIETDNNSDFIKFPAKSSNFGNVCIYEEEVGSYIVDAANDIVDFLEKLFSDQIIRHGSHQGGGC